MKRSRTRRAYIHHVKVTVKLMGSVVDEEGGGMSIPTGLHSVRLCLEQAAFVEVRRT